MKQNKVAALLGLMRTMRYPIQYNQIPSINREIGWYDFRILVNRTKGPKNATGGTKMRKRGNEIKQKARERPRKITTRQVFRFKLDSDF